MSFPRKLTAFGGLFLVLLVLAAGVFYRINGKQDDEAAETAPAEKTDLPAVSANETFDASVPIAVRGVPVVRDTLVLGVTSTGQAAPYRKVTLFAQVNGQVQSVPVRESAAVGAGTLLVGIDPTEFDLAVKEAKAQLEQRRVAYKDLTLFDSTITDPALKASREQAARARSSLETAEIAVSRAELNLSRARVLAPFAGRVANVKVVPGQYVTAGTELLTVVDIDPIKVEVPVLQSEVGWLAPGRGVTLAFDLPGVSTFTGRLATINPIVDEATRSARVTVIVPNPGGRILPGMSAKVRLDARRLPDRILVPREAVLERDGRTLVFIFEGKGDTGVANWQYVKTGLENETYFEIIEDPDDSSTRLLKPGEIVLVDGHKTLTHAAPVRLVQNVAAEGGRPN